MQWCLNYALLSGLPPMIERGRRYLRLTGSRDVEKQTVTIKWRDLSDVPFVHRSIKCDAIHKSFVYDR